jgi:hypothetical protein
MRFKTKREFIESVLSGNRWDFGGVIFHYNENETNPFRVNHVALQGLWKRTIDSELVLKEVGEKTLKNEIPKFKAIGSKMRFETREEFIRSVMNGDKWELDGNVYHYDEKELDPFRVNDNSLNHNWSKITEEEFTLFTDTELLKTYINESIEQAGKEAVGNNMYGVVTQLGEAIKTLMEIINKKQWSQ